MCVQHIPSPVEASKTKVGERIGLFTSEQLLTMAVLSPSTQVEHTYTGPLDDELGDAMLSCNPEVQWLQYVNCYCNCP